MKGVKDNGQEIIFSFLYFGSFGGHVLCGWSCDSIKLKGTIIVEKIERVLVMLNDHILDTDKKRHIAGGVLMSISLLFGGLAITVLTLKSEGENDEY